VNPQLVRNFRVIISLQTVVILLLASSAWMAGYVGRQRLVEASRAACERGKLDSAANAAGWRIAQRARLADGQYAVARNYDRIASDLETRSKIDCERAYPSAKLIQF